MEQTQFGSSESRTWISRLATLLKLRSKDLSIALVTAALGTISALLVPIFERSYIDSITSNTPGHPLLYIYLLIALAAVSFALAVLRRYFGGQLSLGIQHLLRTRIFDHLQRLDFAVHDKLRTGQLVSQANADISLIQGLLAFLPRFFGNLLFAALSLVVMAVVYWPLALVEAISLAIITAASIGLRRSIVPASEVAQEYKGRVNEVVEETVRGIGVVKASALESFQLRKIQRSARILYKARVTTFWRQAKLQAILQLVPLSTQAVIIALGGFAAIHKELSLGSFLLFTTYIIQLDAPIRQLSNLVAIAQQAQAGVNRVFDLLEINPMIVDPATPQPLGDLPLHVEFKDVNFSYEPGQKVLEDLNLNVNAGETIALVGTSGSGKSSIALLIPRFYDVQSGRVTLAGINVQDLSLRELRSKVGVVFEESFLFSDTIRANITVGIPDASEEEVLWAIRAAQAESFINQLPQGLDTVVGERGVKLSGGQRQRIALARALIRKPPLLVLDDATSSIDALTEAEIHGALLAYSKNNTLILIAHRRSTLTLAQRIVLLDKGRIVADGTFDELFRDSNLFRQLIQGNDDLLQEELDETFTNHDETKSELHFDEPLEPPVLFNKEINLKPIDAKFSFKGLFGSIRTGLIFGAIFVALDAALSLAGPLLLREGIDSGVVRSNFHLVTIMALLLGSVSIIDLFVVLLEQMIAGIAAERFLFYLRSHIFKKLLSLGMEYYESEMSGRIMTRMISDVDAFSNLVQTGLVSSLVAIVTFALVITVVIFLSPTLSLVLLAALPFALGAGIVFRRYSVRAYRSARERIAAVNANFQEQISGIRVSVSLGQSSSASDEFSTKSDTYRAARMSAQKAVSLYFPFLLLLADVTTAITLLVGGDLVQSHGLAIGTLLAATLYVNQFFSPIQELSQNFDEYQQVVVATSQIRKLMDEPNAITTKTNATTLAHLQGEIKFQDVCFSYDASTDYSLKNITLTIERGQKVAFVGETGAGKSTIAKLLVRFYDVGSGNIFIDGVSLRDLDLKWYLSNIAYLPQEPFLFSGTLYDNVSFGMDNVGEKDVEAACREVGLGHLLDSHKEGLHYEVGDRAVKLSAGEKQLVVFARLLLRDPRIVILDEVSSSLDLMSERLVQLALNKVALNRTIIIIAHRLISLKDADQIFVVDQGRIQQNGTHEELLSTQGYYRDLWTVSA